MPASLQQVQLSRFKTARHFILLFFALLLLHSTVLRLPYFWDEAGYYIPATRDLFQTGSLIPHSTPSNAHPPLVMAYLALCWKATTYSPLVTRTAMLGFAAFSLLGLGRLAQKVANTPVALATVALSALYPVLFVQSSLAQLDLPAAGFTFWGLLAYVERRRWRTVLLFSLAALTKETAILAPLALFAWEVLCRRWQPRLDGEPASPPQRDGWNTALLLVPCLPLAAWYGFHYLKTGYLLGNPEFFRYNVAATAQPFRILLALGLRVWQSFGYLNLFLLTIVTMLAMWQPPMREEGSLRTRIPIWIQLAFAAVTVAYLGFMAVVGGAVLARYMLPTMPLFILVAVSTLYRRLRYWRMVVGLVALAFVAALLFNPPHGISLEDTLAYRDYIQMHQHGAQFLQTHSPQARVLTAWPSSDELNRPDLGYVAAPLRVLRIEDFTAEQVFAAAEARPNFDVAFVFSTKYEPAYRLFDHWAAWQRINAKYFGFHRDLPPAAIAQVLGGHIVFSESRSGQWAAVIALDQAVDARLRAPSVQK